MVTSMVSAPALRINTSLGIVGYRQAGTLAHTQRVLLHGIGSGSASWAAQLAAVEPHQPGLLAWDAPGYGESDGLNLADAAWPTATHYAERLWAWLDALAGPLDADFVEAASEPPQAQDRAALDQLFD